MRRLALPLILTVVFGTACASTTDELGETFDGKPLDVVAWNAPAIPHEAQINLERAEVLLAAGGGELAVHYLRDLVDEYPSFLEAHRAYQDLFLGTPSDARVRERYRRRLENAPDDPDALYLAARIETDPTRAEELFRAALARSPGHPYARTGLALTLDRAGDSAAALREARRATASAPELQLPWLFAAYVAALHDEEELAVRLFVEAARRDPSDARPHAALAGIAFEAGDLLTASRSAFEAVRREPGRRRVLVPMAEVLVGAGVPEHLEKMTIATDRGMVSIRASVPLHVFRAQCLLALGRADEALVEVEKARSLGASGADVLSVERRAQVIGEQYVHAVRTTLDWIPEPLTGDANLYAGRWRRLETAAERAERLGNVGLQELALALRSVGLRRESAVVAARARAAGHVVPNDDEFDRWLGDVAAIVRDLKRNSDDQPSLDDVLGMLAARSIERLGYDVTEGIVVRGYPLIGSFAVSTASGGRFARELDDRGLFLLVGRRLGGDVEVVLGRVLRVERDARATVLGQSLTYDEIWLESNDLPEPLTRASGGVGGMTLDRLVIIHADAVLHSPEPLREEFPFVSRRARTPEDRVALDTPSALAQRLNAALVASTDIAAAQLDTVRRHELGHVLDGYRLLRPLHHPLDVMRFLSRSRWDADGIQESLEARAAIIALIESAEPRAALASLTGFLPDVRGGSPHVAGYHGVVAALVDEIVVDPQSFPSIDPKDNVLQHLDALTDGEIRELGRRLIERF